MGNRISAEIFSETGPAYNQIDKHAGNALDITSDMVKRTNGLVGGGWKGTDAQQFGDDFLRTTDQLQNVLNEIYEITGTLRGQSDQIQEKESQWASRFRDMIN